jgi:hypothetical protein
LAATTASTWATSSRSGFIEELHLNPEQRKMILGKAAAKLLKLDASVSTSAGSDWD